MGGATAEHPAPSTVSGPFVDLALVAYNWVLLAMGV